MDRPSLQEQLDACRTPTDFSGDPNLRELAEAIANDAQVEKHLEKQIAFDSRMAKELANVSPPHDLKAKLAAAFRQGAALQEQDRSRMGAITGRVVESVSVGGTSVELAIENQKGIIFPKRRFLGRAVAATLAVSVVLVLLFIFVPIPTSTEVAKTGPELANLAHLFCTTEGENWNSDIFGVPKKLIWNDRAIPLSGVSQPTGWRKIDPKLPGNWIVWELNSAKGERIYLLASDAAWKPNLIAPRLLRTPIKNTGTWSVGVWAQGGVTYAVVVQGDANRFKSLIRESNSAMLLRHSKQKQTRIAS